MKFNLKKNSINSYYAFSSIMINLDFEKNYEIYREKIYFRKIISFII